MTVNRARQDMGKGGDVETTSRAMSAQSVELPRVMPRVISELPRAKVTRPGINDLGRSNSIETWYCKVDLFARRHYLLIAIQVWILSLA